LKLLVFALSLFLVMARAEARVFNISSEKFASYFLISGGPSAIKKNAFAGEAAMTDTYSGEATYNYSAEFGFLYATPAMSLRFGFEVFKPSLLKSVTATNAGSTDIYTLDSNITGYAPKLGLEINLQKSSTYRAFIAAYAGSGSVSYKNDYTILNYPGVSNHSVEAKGSGALYGGSLGVESHLTDTTTYVFEFGYRQMKVDNLKYAKDVTTFSGAKTAGSPVVDANDNKRTLDFTGGYVSLGFRFYM
jgi:hypothetical protein